MNFSIGKKSFSAPVSRRALKVLLVDDDPFQVEVISELLRGLDIVEITAVSSGEQGLQKLIAKTARFHLILMDLHMPGMDGFQFMESVARVGFSGALIMVSDQDDDVMKAVTMVAQLRRFRLLGSLPKPVRRALLSALISSLA